MDEVKKLLEGFADQAADALPPADVDADVARGRRALRRIKRRRRATGVLCVAAVTAAVLGFGGQLKWWGAPNDPPVAAGGDQDTPAAGATAGSTSPTPSAGDGTMSLFSAGVDLVANTATWNRIGCQLAPQGWVAEKPIAADRVVLAPPEMRTADTAAKLVLQRADAARSLTAVRVRETAGKTFHIGTLDGRLTGQVKLAEQWLLVEAPAGSADWTDESLQRFMGSCAIN
ncbi:hypothetical protein HPO96_25805 [Kribbella sandramycini]|uniref:Uncharacterized protein n=1 Tax=Kribbella sandramycini TaxID=60450 RepID=A0A7Y4P0Y6_9ACTN|nr:hypothetical protein [Kribbella sandramycini]MBB6570521.1 hypothetical protein [Kribbella sandramycini]NOL43667.1 hypothetical protein [Kribbella sandramycini]